MFSPFCKRGDDLKTIEREIRPYYFHLISNDGMKDIKIIEQTRDFL